jgi:hypothetical protein
VGEEEKGKDVSVQEILRQTRTLPLTPALGQTLRMKEKQTC